MNNTITRLITVLLLTGLVAGLGGCCTFCSLVKDITYSWDIPDSQADCGPAPADGGLYEYKDTVPFSPDLDGGPGIVDRDGGPGIVDRDENHVAKYCLKTCPPGREHAGPPVLDLHNNTNFVRAERRCVPAS
jgi:hypothetical protein